MAFKKQGFKTSAVHTGVYKDAEYNSVITPIYTTSTFYFEKFGQHKGYDYTRSRNPTRSALEENIAALEGGDAAIVTATGMAAITAAVLLCRAGDHIITGFDLYGGTYRLFKNILPQLGITVTFVDMKNSKEVAASIRKETRMVWIETPTNPLLHIIDLKKIISTAKRKKLLTAVDNTFLTPYFQKPFDFGADIVVHSTTKYLNGHSDLVGGAIVMRGRQLKKRLRFIVNTLGLSGAPFDAWLTLRGLKTLGIRMEAHQENAFAIARFLKKHPRVKRVYYPGLKNHPGQDIIKKQMKGFGGIITFELNTQKVTKEQFFKRLRIFHLAESLGGVESLIGYPCTMSHAAFKERDLAAAGITDETIRISAGIEDKEDLIQDLKQALG